MSRADALLQVIGLLLEAKWAEEQRDRARSEWAVGVAAERLLDLIP